jgi:hypothetical protein
MVENPWEEVEARLGLPPAIAPLTWRGARVGGASRGPVEDEGAGGGGGASDSDASDE